MFHDLPSDLERVKAAKKRVEEAKKRVAEDMRAHRDAKRELLRLLAMHRERRTDASAQKVEQALAHFAEANELMERIRFTATRPANNYIRLS